MSTDAPLAQHDDMTAAMLAALREEDDDEEAPGEHVQELLCAGADVNMIINGQSLLALAADAEDENLVEELLARGCRLDPEALVCAALRGSHEIVGRLLTAVPFAVPTRKVYGLYLDGALLNAVRSGGVRAAELLLRAGADPNNPDVKEVRGHGVYSPLHVAARLKWPDMMALLLQYGANATISGESRWEYTPLLEAAKVGRAANVKLLLEVPGALDGACGNLDIALQLALTSEAEPTRTCEMLVRAGANLPANAMEFPAAQTPFPISMFQRWSPGALRKAWIQCVVAASCCE